MNTIKFSHRYKKMPHGVEYLDTYIKDINVVDYKYLTVEQIREDTETVDGHFYPLKEGKKIVIELWSDAIPRPITWFTIRSWDMDKEKYYRQLLGQQVKIVIEIQCACSVLTGEKNLAFKRHSEYDCGNDEIGILKA